MPTIGITGEGARFGEIKHQTPVPLAAKDQDCARAHRCTAAPGYAATHHGVPKREFRTGAHASTVGF
jgi:hypothetical protein